MKRLFTNVLKTSFICLFFLPTALLGQQEKKSPRSKGLIPMDPGVKYGTLSNGFTYYVQSSDEEQHNILIQLVVKTGFQDEQHDQLEFTHFIEHMVFRKTNHFPDVRGLLASMGLRWGTDVNGNTGAKETKYYLNINSQDPALLEKSLLLVRDWAQGGVVFEDAAVNAERGVILEEYRTRQWYVADMTKEYLPHVMGPSVCTDLAVWYHSSKRDNIKKFEHSELPRFYKEWYRPELEAVVVVGNVDADKVEQRLKDLFSDLKSPAKQARKIMCSPDHTTHNGFTTVTHPQMKDTEIKIISRIPYISTRTVNDYRLFVGRSLMEMMIGNRLTQLGLPVMAISITPCFNQYGPPFGVWTTTCSNAKNQLKTEFIRIQQEINRLKKFGFTKEELEYAKDKFLESREVETSSGSLSDLSNKYVAHFTEGVAAPSKEYATELVQNLTREISLAEINTQNGKWLSGADRDIVVLGPELSKQTLPDQASVLSWLEEADRTDLKPFIFKPESKPLLPLMTEVELQHLPAVDVANVEQTNINEIGVTEVSLPNKVKILLKPTSPENSVKTGQVYLKAVKVNGLANSLDFDRFSASCSASVISRSGLGPYNAKDWESYQKNKEFRVVPFISSDKTWIYGFAQAGAIEDMFQATYLYFSNPKTDSLAFSRLLSEKKDPVNAADRIAPRDAFLNAISESKAIEGHDNDRLKPEQIKSLDLNSMYRMYKSEFSDARNFTFVVSGDFDIKNIMPLIIRYLGALPSKHTVENDNKAIIGPYQYAHQGRASRIIYTGADDNNAKVFIQYRGNIDKTVENEVEIDMLVRILEMQTLRRLRDQEGLIYSPAVGGYCDKEHRGLFYLFISFSCTTTNVQKCISSMKDEIDQLCHSDVPADVLESAKADLIRNYDASCGSPEFWCNYLSNQVLFCQNLSEITRYKMILDGMTPEMIRLAANRYLSDSNRMEFMLLSGDDSISK